MSFLKTEVLRGTWSPLLLTTSSRIGSADGACDLYRALGVSPPEGCGTDIMGKSCPHTPVEDKGRDLPTQVDVYRGAYRVQMGMCALATKAGAAKGFK